MTMTKSGADAFKGYNEHCLASEEPTVLMSNPPTYLVGNVSDEEKVIA